LGSVHPWLRNEVAYGEDHGVWGAGSCPVVPLRSWVRSQRWKALKNPGFEVWTLNLISVLGVAGAW
jgi:hypothetical protein